MNYPLKYLGLLVGQPFPLDDAQLEKSVMAKEAIKATNKIFFICFLINLLKMVFRIAYEDTGMTRNEHCFLFI